MAYQAKQVRLRRHRPHVRPGPATGGPPVGTRRWRHPRPTHRQRCDGHRSRGSADRARSTPVRDRGRRGDGPGARGIPCRDRFRLSRASVMCRRHRCDGFGPGSPSISLDSDSWRASPRLVDVRINASSASLARWRSLCGVALRCSVHDGCRWGSVGPRRNRADRPTRAATDAQAGSAASVGQPPAFAVPGRDGARGVRTLEGALTGSRRPTVLAPAWRRQPGRQVGERGQHEQPIPSLAGAGR